MSFYYFPPADEESEAHSAPSWKAGVRGPRQAVWLRDPYSCRFYHSDLYILFTLCLLGVSNSVTAILSISHEGCSLNRVAPASQAALAVRILLLHNVTDERSVCARGSYVATYVAVWNALHFYEYVSSHVRLHLYDFATS